MTRAFAVDENNDIYVGGSGSLAIADGLTAVMQAVQQAAETQLEEMEYATDQGVPNFSVVWNGAPNVQQFEAYLRQAILGVQHVAGIKDLAITVSGGVLSYAATVITDFGVGVLNG